ncbi:MAG: epoxyqueuosine reductase QueH [Planctomycetota bacterium]
MRILLHVCCGPCAIEPFEQLTDEGHEVTGYFYNPNIHPLVEFRRRLKAARVLQERLPIPIIYNRNYGLRRFLERVDWRGDGRCADCYRLRLGAVAQAAAERGFDAMTTTLLGSRHQDHDALRRIGREAAGAAGTNFLCADWRGLSDRGHERARGMNLYLQNYCGCIFSEQERFEHTTRHLYRGPGPQAEAVTEGE